MTTPFRRRLRLARRGAWYSVVAVVALMALAGVVAGQALAWAERNPARVAGWLGELAGRPIAFDRLDTEWTRHGPLLRVDGLRIGHGAGAFPVGEAEILVSQYSGLLPGRAFTELRLRGLELTLERDDEGRWSVRGLPGAEQSQGDPFSALDGLGELQVTDGRLHVHAPGLGIEATLPRANLRLRVDGQRVRAATRAWMQAERPPIDVVAEFDRDSGDGRAHAATRRADLSAWADILHFAGIGIDGGAGRMEVWARLEGMRVAQVDVDADLSNVALRGAPLDGEPTAMQFSSLAVVARMRAEGRDWRVDAPRLRIGTGTALQTLDGLVLAGGGRRALLARRVDAAPLAGLAGLSDRLDAPLRRWLLAAAPGAVLHEIEVVGDAGGRLRASARIEGAGFAAVGELPGVAGLGGTVEGDAEGFVFRIDPASTLRFDWPAEFRETHEISLDGSVAGWRQGEGFQLQTPALRIEGDGYAADVRGGLGFQGDGSRPLIDLAAALDEARVPVARRFWLRQQMPEAAVRWLDEALVDGVVREGRAVLSGDLDDWPFSSLDGAQHRGVFHARGKLSGAVLRFQDDWPPLEGVEGTAEFVNDGLVFSGRGTLAGVGVDAVRATLAHYDRAELQVRASAASAPAERLLALLRASPLRAAKGEMLDGLAVGGPASAGFAFDLRMHGGKHPPRIDGALDLRGVKADMPDWGLAFEQVRGQLRYDHNGFSAEGLDVVGSGQPGSLSLRAGRGHVQDPQRMFEATLDATLEASTLLARVPGQEWLIPHVDGASRWQVSLSAPESAPGQGGQVPVDLRLHSDLRGTALALPAPLGKPAQDALPARVQLRLPADRNEVSVALGERLALRARSVAGGTAVRIALGGASAAEPPAQPGLFIGGRVDVLDALDWASLGSGGGDGPPLRSLDVVAGELRLPVSRFGPTRLTAAAAEGATELSFDGEAIAGSLRLPDVRTATVTGRFQRLHLAPVDAGAATARSAEAAARPGEAEVDPSKIPPLHLDVADLRLGALVLGEGTLRTQPVAGGLEIERLQARSPVHRIDVTGQWTGTGAEAATRLEIDAGSEDFGTLLEGLGFGRRIEGGSGELHFSAAWPRSPAAFELTALEGSLRAVVKDGRLIEVEPGAGRVLGLLSVAELPRRMMLDFRDFFSTGFAFNRLAGTVDVADGQATSDGIVIDGPAAEIRLRGRSDLRRQVHDQTIEVTPRTGNLLPAVGAIAAGPVGAAVGAVANAMLRKPLGEMSAKTYRVSGPWKDPTVEVADHAPRPAAAAPSPPPPADL